MKNGSLKCFPSFLRKHSSSQRNIVQHSLRQIHLLKKMINDIYGSQWTGLPAGIGLMFESWFWSYHQPWSWLYSHYLHDSPDLPKICLILLILLLHLTHSVWLCFRLLGWRFVEIQPFQMNMSRAWQIKVGEKTKP